MTNSHDTTTTVSKSESENPSLKMEDLTNTGEKLENPTLINFISNFSNFDIVAQF